ncbi:MAG: hypothetical protein KDG89_07990 [Geminicoccaceae bacterium]|nr:hypothetical protein [Geminicoccaceae bacterium]
MRFKLGCGLACEARTKSAFTFNVQGMWGDLDGPVRIGVGRDTAEVRPTGMKVWIEPAEPRAEAHEPTIQAISLTET